MIIAIMQPYFLPYIGYFQLMSAVDKFVIYDDVAYIKGGWINRNRLLLNGMPHMFTVPVQSASPNRLICDLDIDDAPHWKEKLLKTMVQAYSKSPQFESAYPLLERIVMRRATKLSEYVLNSLAEICSFLEIQTEIVPTSRRYNNSHLKAQDRVIDICLREAAAKYINPVGGTELYSKGDFSRHGIELSFLQPNSIEYPQRNHPFVPWLSILDILMFNDKKNINTMLKERILV